MASEIAIVASVFSFGLGIVSRSVINWFMARNEEMRSEANKTEMETAIQCLNDDWMKYNEAKKEMAKIMNDNVCSCDSGSIDGYNYYSTAYSTGEITCKCMKTSVDNVLQQTPQIRLVEKGHVFVPNPHTVEKFGEKFLHSVTSMDVKTVTDMLGTFGARVDESCQSDLPDEETIEITLFTGKNGFVEGFKIVGCMEHWRVNKYTGKLVPCDRQYFSQEPDFVDSLIRKNQAAAAPGTVGSLSHAFQTASGPITPIELLYRPSSIESSTEKPPPPTGVKGSCGGFSVMKVTDPKTSPDEQGKKENTAKLSNDKGVEKVENTVEEKGEDVEGEHPVAKDVKEKEDDGVYVL